MAESMQAISVWQPWAWLMVHGHKDVENRPQPVPSTWELPRTIYIHAAKRAPIGSFPDLRQVCRELGIELPDPGLELAKGALVGEATIVELYGPDKPAEQSRWWVGASRLPDRKGGRLRVACLLLRSSGLVRGGHASHQGEGHLGDGGSSANETAPPPPAHRRPSCPPLVESTATGGLAACRCAPAASSPASPASETAPAKAIPPSDHAGPRKALGYEARQLCPRMDDRHPRRSSQPGQLPELWGHQGRLHEHHAL